MNADTAVTLATNFGLVAGAFFGGRITGRSAAQQIATDTVDMLQTQIQSLKEDKEDRDEELIELRGRVDVLENLVTQRAEVELVHQAVRDSRVVLDKIAEKVGA